MCIINDEFTFFLFKYNIVAYEWFLSYEKYIRYSKKKSIIFPFNFMQK